MTLEIDFTICPTCGRGEADGGCIDREACDRIAGQRLIAEMSNHGGCTAEVRELSDCDFCGNKHQKASYEGATTFGGQNTPLHPWAFMCEAHFKEYGRGLGWGIGQKLV